MGTDQNIQTRSFYWNSSPQFSINITDAHFLLFTLAPNDYENVRQHWSLLLYRLLWPLYRSHNKPLNISFQLHLHICGYIFKYQLPHLLQRGRLSFDRCDVKIASGRVSVLVFKVCNLGVQVGCCASSVRQLLDPTWTDSSKQTCHVCMSSGSIVCPSCCNFLTSLPVFQPLNLVYPSPCPSF